MRSEIREIRVLTGVAALALALVLLTPRARADEHFRGCLFGTHDNYLLRTDSGELYRLRSFPDDQMRAHLGDTVDVSGQIKDSPREREAQEQASSQNAAGVAVAQHAIAVTQIATLSRGCAQVRNGVAVIVPVPAPGTTVVVPPQAVATVPGTTAVVPTAVVPAQTVTTVPGTATATTVPQSAIVVNNGPLQHFVGCMVGTEDFFVLKATDGTLYRLRAQSGLREHVGNTVDVTGRIDNSQREADAQRQAEVASRVGVAVPQLALDVDSIQTVANGCATR